MVGTSVTAAIIVVSVYFCAMAVIGHFSPGLGVFSVKSAICVVLGAILGIFVSTPLFGVDTTLGCIGMGASIGLMYILFFSGVINAIINRIPQNIRHGFRVAFNSIRVVLIVAVIILTVVTILKYIGI